MRTTGAQVQATKIVKRYTLPTNGRQFATVEFSDGDRIDVITRSYRDSLPLFATAREIKEHARRIKIGRKWQ